MKWIFVLLLGVNVVLVGLQWLQQREVSLKPVYEEGNAEEIRLLSELDGVDVKEGDARCLLVGPSSSDEEMRALAQEFKGVGVSADAFVRSKLLSPSYWVLYRVSGGQVADVLLRDFKERGYDSYVVSSGEQKGMISLGVFENIDLARTLKKKLLKINYPVEIQEKRKTQNEYWVQASVQNTLSFKEKVADLSLRLDKSKKMREIFCKSVASENKFP